RRHRLREGAGRDAECARGAGLPGGRPRLQRRPLPLGPAAREHDDQRHGGDGCRRARWPDADAEVPGFEPRLTGSEPVVLPLNYPPSRAGAGFSDATAPWQAVPGAPRPLAPAAAPGYHRHRTLTEPRPTRAVITLATTKPIFVEIA